jgi:hypothetical protein
MCTESKLNRRESYIETHQDFFVSELYGGVLWCASGEYWIVVLYKDWGRWAARCSESEWFSDSVSCGVLWIVHRWGDSVQGDMKVGIKFVLTLFNVVTPVFVELNRLLRSPSSKMWHHAIWWIGSNVFENPIVSTFRYDYLQYIIKMETAGSTTFFCLITKLHGIKACREVTTVNVVGG